ncbi:MAG TPA: GNAT family N-acetyltransferase [Patescibacteria group bacterium]|nr:GNAT family N-acetyltransferase [Patescibacteria group bacterium]
MSKQYEIGDDLRIARTRVATRTFAQLAQPIGYEAWTVSLSRGNGERTDTEIRHMFDPNDGYHNTERLYSKMRGKIGTFVGVVAVLRNQMIGYAWATDDVGTLSVPRQYAKRAAYEALGKRPYASVAQLNTLPKYQGQGVGSIMLEEVLRPFDPNQRPTAYVFDENKEGLDWWTHRGFRPRPEVATPKYTYFGEGAAPVDQWRLEAYSVGSVQARVSSYGPDLPYYEVVESARHGYAPRPL